MFEDYAEKSSKLNSRTFQTKKQTIKSKSKAQSHLPHAHPTMPLTNHTPSKYTQDYNQINKLQPRL